MISPRKHAAHIISLDTREERREYLATQVPDNYREWVRTIVVNHFGLLAVRKKPNSGFST